MSILKQIAQENGYIFESQGTIMYGQKNNYTFLASEVGNGVITLMFSVKNDSAVQTLDAKVLKMEIPTVQHCSFKNHKLTVTVKGGMTKSKRRANVLAALESLTVYLSTRSYVQACELTGETNDVHLYQVGNQYSFLTPEAFGNVSRDLDRSEQESLQTSENVFLGFIGAVLGSIIGVAAIVLVGQLGYVSVLSGMAMGACVVKGYELLARRFSTKGAIISILVSLVMTYFANQLDWSVSFARYYEVSIFDALPYIHDFVAEGYIDSYTYYFNLAVILIFNVVAAAITIGSALKNTKTKFEVRKLF